MTLAKTDSNESHFEINCKQITNCNEVLSIKMYLSIKNCVCLFADLRVEYCMWQQNIWSRCLSRTNKKFFQHKHKCLLVNICTLVEPSLQYNFTLWLAYGCYAAIRLKLALTAVIHRIIPFILTPLFLPTNINLLVILLLANQMKSNAKSIYFNLLYFYFIFTMNCLLENNFLILDTNNILHLCLGRCLQER